MTGKKGACGLCVYWDLIRERKDEGLQDEGLCRRRAPVAIASADIDFEGEDASGVVGLLAAWPRTFGLDWCGDYRYCGPSVS